jgi:hypothetical protein
VGPGLQPALWRCPRPVSLASQSPPAQALAALGALTHPAGMFVVTEAEAAAIRAVYEQCGEFSAAVELRRLFPGVLDNAEARECARAIAGWKLLPAKSRSGDCARGRTDRPVAAAASATGTPARPCLPD